MCSRWPSQDHVNHVNQVNHVNHVNYVYIQYYMYIYIYIIIFSEIRESKNWWLIIFKAQKSPFRNT